MLRPSFLLRATAPTRRLLPPRLASPRLLTTASPAQPTDAAPSPAPTRTVTEPFTSTTTTTTATATPAAAATTTTTTAPVSRPYFVSRTPSKNLPVYQDAKRGGNLKMTYLKKVEGDAQALKQNLAEQLSLRPDQIRLNPVTGHIQISGHFKDKVATYLTEQGF
ncbi:mitochondrial large subunit ribosomal protein-domain-containing protein [Phialemonium atrogriseum]|uniref:Large ribosomal subunit protein mL49 n=1 Tax=Phialemonium atrogriseum TaxID=1093897 RepID=A0AAJ0C289_9PEZI|nr:mitochondrial large subunit ribosomal protein-domain-containing protein [Phialemonium atrogriseum]KAK1767377.1 mitochondrial large subunit ribosomal protein-domain-containing protein [Phialemonium atrogriseum]